MSQRLRLRSELRKIRMASGKSQRAIADSLDWSLSKVTRIEAGLVAVSSTDLRAMLDEYGMHDPGRRAFLLGLAKGSKEKDWWHDYKDVTSPAYRRYLGHESTASLLRSYQPNLVPGLLQIQSYAREVLEKTGVEGARVDDHVELRLERQERLADRAQEQHFLIDESVLRKQVGGPETMRRQLEHLLRVLDRPSMTLLVVPFSHGLHPYAIAAYTLLEFTGSDDTMAFIESPTGDLVLTERSPENPEMVARLLDSFFQFEQELAAEPDITTDLIRDALRQLDKDRTVVDLTTDASPQQAARTPTAGPHPGTPPTPES